MKSNLQGCIYTFPGLGATSAMFKDYRFANYDFRHIEWQEPQRGETLKSYAARYLPQIDKSKPVVFLGVSFGGIIATELARIYKPSLLILISSVPSAHSIPFKFRMGRLFPLARISGSLIKKCIPLVEWTFGIKSEENSKLFRQMTEEVSPAFFPWAIHVVSGWRGEQSEGVVTLVIHGAKDLVFPAKKIKYDYLIDGAGHFMAVEDYEKVIEIIEKELSYGML